MIYVSMPLLLASRVARALWDYARVTACAIAEMSSGHFFRTKRGKSILYFMKVMQAILLLIIGLATLSTTLAQTSEHEEFILYHDTSEKYLSPHFRKDLREIQTINRRLRKKFRNPPLREKLRNLFGRKKRRLKSKVLKSKALDRKSPFFKIKKELDHSYHGVYSRKRQRLHRPVMLLLTR